MVLIADGDAVLLGNAITSFHGGAVALGNFIASGSTQCNGGFQARWCWVADGACKVATRWYWVADGDAIILGNVITGFTVVRQN